jgi:lipopolysaccharide biosynthesis glycosyltransferase
MIEKTREIHILYASNDGYAPHLAASMYSLLENNRQLPHLTIHILSVKMSRECQKKLEKVAAGFGRSFDVIEMGDLFERFPYEVDTRGFDISAMARIFAPDVLCEEVGRCLYLDCDTIVTGSIKELYEVSLGECLAAMVMEPTVYQSMKETIGMGQHDAYFNSGVILMDLEGWRRQQTVKKMLDFYGEHSGSLFACDQDTINGVLKGKIKPLSPRYNFFTNYRYFHYKTLVSQCRAYEQTGKEDFCQAKKKPVIIHYLGDERPWIYGNHNYYRKAYLHYLGKTPWKGMEPVKGKWMYMQLWWCFNKVSFLCPPLRLLISRHFGMKVIDQRRKKR